MRNPFRTQKQALIADIVCWVSLISLLGYAAYTVANPVVTGVLLAVIAIVGAFALLYNGSNVRTVVRSYMSSKRYEREEAERQVQYKAEQAERDSRDAEYGRELRDLNNRYNY